MLVEKVSHLLRVNKVWLTQVLSYEKGLRGIETLSREIILSKLFCSLIKIGSM